MRHKLSTLMEKSTAVTQSVISRFAFMDSWQPDRAFYVLNAMLFLALLVSLGDVLWVSVLAVFTNLVLVLWRQREKHIFFLLFLMSFFGFLMTRDTMHRIFYYPKNEGAHLWLTQFLLLFAFIGLILGYFFIPKVWASQWGAQLQSALMRLIAPLKHWCSRAKLPVTSELLRTSAQLFMVVLFPIALIGVLRILVAVDLSDYQKIYSAEFVAQFNSGISGAIFNYARRMLMVAHALFLATMPPKKEVLRWSSAVALIPIFSLGIGIRAELSLFVLLMLFYTLVRRAKNARSTRVTHRSLGLAAVGAAILMLMFSALERLRGVGNSRGLFDFVYNQGVSIRALENTIAHRSMLPKQNYLLEFAHTGFLARLLNMPTPRGNTVAHAVQGDSLAHSLSYVVLGPTRYKAGLGTGSSFLAEGYAQWGVLGVLVVSVIYGLLIFWIGRYEYGGVGGKFLRLLLLPTVLWAPRGSATAFISVLLQTPTILATFFMVTLALFLSWRKINAPAEVLLLQLAQAMWARLRRINLRRLVSRKQKRV